ncbi:MAG: adenylosuccinate lyase [Bacteroidales bacterium]|nr:adenylosuccinate lyase [Bacteroidales bacterium]
MEFSPLTTVSPIDGRYYSKTVSLSEYFSEYALFKYRTRVEVEYFIALCNLPLPELKSVNHAKFPILRKVYEEFSVECARKIKEIEKTTNHDVKAVEYFVKDKMEAIGLGAHKEFVHFGLTSQDINNTAFPLMMLEAHKNVLLPALESLKDHLNSLAHEWKDIAMLARTHGQPASPTRLGKEIFVFVERLDKQVQSLNAIPFSGKFGGATGNMNAHAVCYPKTDWETFANDFLKNQLGLIRQKTTTQIEHYDDLAAYFDALKRINNILIDLSRDIWLYISMDYFKQKIKAGEVGSSAMPHKVNPIDFENAEGNLGVANALLEHLAGKLPISRLQRDLTDSTVTRNIGVPIAHMMISVQSLEKGLGKLILNEKKIESDLENNWAVVAEAIQSILRRENYPNPYEALKNLTRTNKPITEELIQEFIDTLDVSENLKKELKAIRPENYTGIELL